MGRLTTFLSVLLAGNLFLNVAKAEEAAEPLRTALASTTISGYLDVEGQWNPGTGTFTAMTPSGPIAFEISSYEAELMYLAALLDREEFIEGLLQLKAKNPFIEFTPENFDPMLLVNPPDLPEVVPPVVNPKLLYLPEWWLIYKGLLPVRQIPTRTLRLSPTHILPSASTAPAIQTYLTNTLRASYTTLRTIDLQLATNHLVISLPIQTNVVTLPPIITNPGGSIIEVIQPPPSPPEVTSPSQPSGLSFSAIRISLDIYGDRQNMPMPPRFESLREGVNRDAVRPEPTKP